MLNVNGEVVSIWHNYQRRPQNQAEIKDAVCKPSPHAWFSFASEKTHLYRSEPEMVNREGNSVSVLPRLCHVDKDFLLFLYVHALCLGSTCRNA